MNRPANNKTKGQLLIEVIISLTILLLVILGVFPAAATTIKNNSYAQKRTLASHYLRQEIENTRRALLSDWNYNTAPVSPSPFTITRIIVPDPVYPNLKKVTVTVSWQEGANTRSAKTITLMGKGFIAGQGP